MATRDDDEAALRHLRRAVARGFDDLASVARSEVWGGLRNHPEYRELVLAAKTIRRYDAQWPAWSDFKSSRAPQSVQIVLDARSAALARIEAMAPALGTPQVSRWNRMIDRVMAARLESYIADRAEADDAEQAVDELLGLYAGGVLQRWRKVTPDVAERLRTAAELLLRRDAVEPVEVVSSRRADALLAEALGHFADRDKKGRLSDESVERVDQALSELLTDHAASELAPVAAVGAVLTAQTIGEEGKARTAFARFVDASDDEPARLERFRSALGDTALLYGGLPSFSAESLDGETCSDESLDGRVAVIDFWATWCGPCLEGFESLRRIDERFGDKVTLVGINLDEPAMIPGDGLEQWIASQRVPGTQIHDGLAWESALVRAFGVSEIPFTVVVDPGGEVVAVNEHGKSLVRTVASAVKVGELD